jgi:ribosomal peptide maturation radical SAM protein 1
MSEKRTDICICVMPFCPVQYPNLGVSLIKSALKRNGISSKIFYFNLKMVKEIGLRLYNSINGQDFALNAICGELIFSEYLFDKKIDNYYNVYEMIKGTSTLSDHDIYSIIEELELTRKLVPRYIRECTGEVLTLKPKLVGFSTSYYQNCSSLSLAREIKKKSSIPIIFGGSNCEGEMGFALLSCFPEIDYVCSGDGDNAFIEFVKNFIKEKEMPKLNGILTKCSTPLEVNLTDPVMNLNKLPFPDFDDYFETIRDSSLTQSDIKIGIETSRGCWWGELSQCTFCGLNGSTMKYRSKLSERIIDEIEHLTEKYNIRAFQFVDNILDPKYFQHLFPKMINKKMNLWMFYETKANLSKEDLVCMKKAGVQAIQPGIESLSDIVLNIMQKGTTMLQNIYLLKLCKEINIWPYWNIIVGFPGEPIEEYYRMSQLVPILFHLHPPEFFSKFRLSRYSPYFQEADRYGITDIQPLPMYRMIYPFDQDTIRKLVYFFEHDYSDKRIVSEYTNDLKKRINEWKYLWQEREIPILNLAFAKDMIIIRDTRPCSIQQTFIITSEEAKVYNICEQPQRLDTVYRRMSEMYSDITYNDVISMLQNFCKNKIMLENEGQYMSLAIPTGINEHG